MSCSDPRPTACNLDYKPVCAEVDTGVRCITAPCPSSERKDLLERLQGLPRPEGRRLRFRPLSAVALTGLPDDTPIRQQETRNDDFPWKRPPFALAVATALLMAACTSSPPPVADAPPADATKTARRRPTRPSP
jgi:hypothetical protein